MGEASSRGDRRQVPSLLDADLTSQPSSLCSSLRQVPAREDGGGINAHREHGRTTGDAWTQRLPFRFWQRPSTRNGPDGGTRNRGSGLRDTAPERPPQLSG